MITDLLTKRAKLALLELPKKKRIGAVEILEKIRKTEGMGSYLLNSIKNIQLPKNESISVELLLKEAYRQALKLEHPYVGTEHLLLALIVLTKSTDLTKLRTELLKLSVFPNTIRPVEKTQKTPMLDSFGENLNQKAFKNLDNPPIYRSEYDLILAALLQKNNQNVLLVGDIGVGKRSLIDLLAKNIISLDIPSALVGYQVIDFDIMAFLTGVFSKGGIDFGLGALSDELRSMGRVIISLKNFQSIFFATNVGLTMPMFYSMFKSTLENAGVRIIATINTGLYDKLVSENEHLIQDFTVVEVGEPMEKDIIKILQNNAKKMEKFHNIIISDEVIKHIYKKASESQWESKFPAKGIEILDKACGYLIMKKSKIPTSYKKMVDTSFDILTGIDSQITKGNYDNAVKMRSQLKDVESRLLRSETRIFLKNKIKLTLRDIDESIEATGNVGEIDTPLKSINKLSGLSEQIKKRIIGQDDAVVNVVKSLIRSKLGLRSKKRPLGNFLFLGPTGVGKTELAKVLAQEFFGEKSLIRLDMSDFSEKHTVARLVGAPPGYVGYGEGGELTTKISERPNSVVLFDEIEKAHPDVLNILLQVMEEAELADARGNTFDFSKAVVVLTSNLGTEILHESEIGYGDTKVTDKTAEGRLRGNLKKILKPELINRFDEVIVFRRLQKPEQLLVLDVLLGEVIQTLKLQKIKLSVPYNVRQFLLGIGYSEEYGARSLRRTLEKQLLDVIAEFLLKHNARPVSLKAALKEKELYIKIRNK